MTDPVSQAETIVRDSEQQRRRSRRRRGFILAGTLTVSLLTGPLWAAPSDGAAACTPITAGRAGTLPCERSNTRADDAVEKFIGTTVTGCLLGGIFGGVPGAIAGCVGGAAGNIAW